MRKYTLVFMEQKIGLPRLTPIEAADDEAAQGYVREHFLQRLQNCVRAELSSLAIVPEARGSKSRLIDDSLENPHFQESYIRYDARSKRIEIDFVSTATGLLPVKHVR